MQASPFFCSLQKMSKKHLKMYYELNIIIKLIIIVEHLETI